jgi:hypothetical protein
VANYILKDKQGKLHGLAETVATTLIRLESAKHLLKAMDNPHQKNYLNVLHKELVEIITDAAKSATLATIIVEGGELKE